MASVFIGGSRRISRINGELRRRIDSILDKRIPVLIGDANGADKAVQRYLHDRGYPSVRIFCAGERCRNNVGDWPVQAISVPGKRVGFAFYATKDRAMADEATVGLMIWDGGSVGTLMNVLRLLDREKAVAVYVAPDKRFVDIRAKQEFDSLVSTHAPELRVRLDRESAAEFETAVSSRQASLF